MLKFLNKKRATSMLGLALDGSNVEAVVVRRTNGSVQAKESLNGPLNLADLSDNPDAVGRELRKQLDAAGIRERNCAVCLPLKWVLTVHTKVPDLPEADLASFLELEAERGFPAGHENLHIANSRSRAPGGEMFATMMAVPRANLSNLERALKAAQLRPVTFSLALAALETETKDPAVEELRLLLGGAGIELQVSAGGGILALRSLDGAMETEGGQQSIDTELVARELRITLGQLPTAFSNATRNVKVIGPWEIARKFITDISPRTESLGLSYELVERATTAHFVPGLPSEKTISPALALAANWVRNIPPVPEFLPPKVNPWEQLLTAKFGSKRMVWAGAGAGGLLLLIGGAFFIQQCQLYWWNSKWEAMQKDVAKIETDQQQIRKYRPWFDESFRSLRILRKLTEVFPEDGMVTVKTIEVRDRSAVTCSGIARDRQSVLKVIEQLSAAKEVSELNPESLRGQSPAVQFTFNFQWEGESGSGN